ncbi:adenosylcobalamin-dependent ribonucleoside-diphosphate reductase [Epibacterium sp. MM17-32]|uniref:adenosylcobalamin-dependent ribonucleoside-diphosphate reductase n=1 Tax=Epibacterium sp. MM17-32 TaxID=2917734 RepID=UPI001EF5C43D|nr:adenosylcobalamin-dependent ribonucleoside-diphosphate reductase [Epibacterium sp. MM17-32]MCG7628383.1 adenosylcobalamin-dependent ribonucleoside-diphosphate reductase [Epibacterium sp. MM17-32]
MNYGPELLISEEIGASKHRLPGESFEDAMRRIAHALADDPDHEAGLLDILLNRRFIPAGRIQSAAGNFRSTTAFNCFVSGTIPDSMVGIMKRNTEAALTMQKGGGIGYNFGTIRPQGADVTTMQTHASGPLSFMEVYNSTCKTVASAGDRRGAQMAVMPVWHPDIRKFIHAKANNDVLTQFNMSVGITDAFMYAVLDDEDFNLEFDGEVYATVKARDLWDEIMAMTWDWAEPGVLFIDRINQMNNLYYCETIAATNPCGEQPLPPFGACLLGSFNWAAYVFTKEGGGYGFDLPQLLRDIHAVVRAMDNVIDRTIYPLPEQEAEAKAKRRMGLGAMGVANALEAIGHPYGTAEAIEFCDMVMQRFANECYRASALLAGEKGAFPLYDESYLHGEYIGRLDSDVFNLIARHGIRNSHLTSIAPTGSISLAADNVSSGIEPPFMHSHDRIVRTTHGQQKVETVTDYGYRVFGVKGRTANELTPLEHVGMLNVFQKWVDSACSKTCNIGDDVTYDEFKEVYIEAWRGGAKGCTTFRMAGKRFGILSASEEDQPKPTLWQRIKAKWASLVERPEPPEETPEFADGASCTFDPATGKKTCE